MTLAERAVEAIGLSDEVISDAVPAIGSLQALTLFGRAKLGVLQRLIDASTTPTEQKVELTKVAIPVSAPQPKAAIQIRDRIQDYMARYSAAIKHRIECKRMEARLWEFAEYLNYTATEWEGFRQDPMHKTVLEAVTQYSRACLDSMAAGGTLVP
jgi:hypothetical protein